MILLWSAHVRTFMPLLRSFRHPPEERRGELEAIPGRVTEINGTRSTWPADVLLHFDAVLFEVSDPQVQFPMRDGKGDMSRARGAMGSHFGVQERFDGVENEQ